MHVVPIQEGEAPEQGCYQHRLGHELVPESARVNNC